MLRILTLERLRQYCHKTRTRSSLGDRKRLYAKGRVGVRIKTEREGSKEGESREGKR